MAGATPNRGAGPQGNGMRVIVSVDAMGGDRGESVVMAGIARALQKNSDLDVIVHGDEARLAPLTRRWSRVVSGRLTIRHCDAVVAMDAKPSHAMRHGEGTSMWSAIESVRNGEAKACVSCGNTGALMAMSMLRLRRVAGVTRPAIAAFWPSRNPQGFNVMLDVGADIKADPEDLLRFALMGASYARHALEVEQPRIGLLNVGTEEIKGRMELRQAAELIEARAAGHNFTFVGFVEGSDITSADVDVIVTDGFTGNVALKTAEGIAKLIGEFLGDAFRHSIWSRIGALFALTSLERLKKRIDPRRMNGGVFLGLNGTVVKSHGSADRLGVAAAVGLACRLARSGSSERVAIRLATLDAADDGPASVLGTSAASDATHPAKPNET